MSEPTKPSRSRSPNLRVEDDADEDANDPSLDRGYEPTATR